MSQSTFLLLKLLYPFISGLVLSTSTPTTTETTNPLVDSFNDGWNIMEQMGKIFSDIQENSTNKISTLQTENMEKNKTINNLEIEILTEKEKVTKLQAESVLKDNIIKNLETEKNKLVDVANIKEKELDDSKSKLDETASRIKELEKMALEFQNKINEQKQINNNLQQQNEDLKIKNKYDLASRDSIIDELDKKLQHQEKNEKKKIQKLEDKIKSLKKEKNDNHEKLAQIKDLLG